MLIRDDFIFDKACYESVSDNLPDGVLREISGPLAEWDELNRNKRKYSERLWDNVLDSSYVKEQLRFKTLLGEGNHPADRYEVDFDRVSHRITEMHKVPDKHQIWGTIQILDTRLGNVLEVLYKSGSVLGYSSRAGGTLNKKKDYIDVDERTYNFITFDAVPYPSVEIARPGAIDEGVENKTPINEEAIMRIKEIVDESGEREKAIIKEFISSLRGYDTRDLDKLFEGVDSNTDSGESLQDTAMFLLKESAVQINELRVENATLKTENAELKEKSGRLKNRLDEVLEKVNSLVKEGTKTDEVKELSNTIISLKNQLKNYDEVCEDLENITEKASALEESLYALKLERDALKKENRKLCESTVNLQSVVEDAERKAFQVSESYTRAVGASAEEYDNLEGRYQEVVERVDECEETAKTLRGELERVKRERKEAIKEAEMAERRLESVKESYDSECRGYKSRISVLEDAVSKSRHYKSEMVRMVCANYGVDESKVLELLKEDFNKSDIYAVCESLGREVKEMRPAQKSEKGETFIKNFYGTNRRGNIN